MSVESKSGAPEVCEMAVDVCKGKRMFSIGVPRNADAGEKRFPLTPEGVAQLVGDGFTVRVEEGAGAVIHYTDAAYARAGASVCGREEVLCCDIVVSLPMPGVADLRCMRRGAMLLTLKRGGGFDRRAVRALLERNIVCIALDMFRDERGHLPFADILAEVDGRAAMARASSLLADSTHGKGILLGGIAGVMPCEVLVLGSGMAGRCAARSAVGLGAKVTMLDSDTYRLRDAQGELGCGVTAGSLQPRALETALRTADVVVYAGVEPVLKVDSGLVAVMKRGVLVFDLSEGCGAAFPSLATVDLSLSGPVDLSPTEVSRVCYVNSGSLVPRTAAMAISDGLLRMFGSIMGCEGLTNSLKLIPGLQVAALTFLGKPVNAEIARTVGLRHVDINIYLTLS